MEINDRSDIPSLRDEQRLLIAMSGRLDSLKSGLVTEMVRYYRLCDYNIVDSMSLASSNAVSVLDMSLYYRVQGVAPFISGISPVRVS